MRVCCLRLNPQIGPAPFITAVMVLSLVQKMKLEKSPTPSNIFAEMLKASPDPCRQLIAELGESGKVPEE